MKKKYISQNHIFFLNLHLRDRNDLLSQPKWPWTENIELLVWSVTPTDTQTHLTDSKRVAIRWILLDRKPWRTKVRFAEKTFILPFKERWFMGREKCEKENSSEHRKRYVHVHGGQLFRRNLNNNFMCPETFVRFHKDTSQPGCLPHQENRTFLCS